MTTDMKRYREDPSYRKQVRAKQNEYYAKSALFRARRIAEAVKWAKDNPEKARANILKSKRKKYPTPTRSVPEACEICGLRSDVALCLDHCHLTHTFRGWICRPCNIGLGNFRDSPEVLERAAAYLRRHRA